MRAIVHFGMSKTGSTSLQKTFAAHREKLARAGVLYPALTRQPHHIYLLPAIFRPGEWKREFGDLGEANVARVMAASARSWDLLDAQVRDSDADTVVISSEHVIGLSREAKQALHARIAERFDEVELAGYVRSPGSHYLSSLQQSVKFSKTFRPPGSSLRYRNKLAALEALSGRGISVRVFARPRLEAGCICTDFMRHSVGRDIGELGIKVVNDNASLSAEGMALMQEFNRSAWDGAVPFGSALNRTLIRLIQFEESKRPYTKPRLRPEIVAIQDAANHRDVHWLRDEMGLTFDDFDYDTPDAPPPDMPDPEDLAVADVCDVDPEKLAGMRYRLLKKLVSGVNDTARAREAKEAKEASSVG